MTERLIALGLLALAVGAAPAQEPATSAPAAPEYSEDYFLSGTRVLTLDGRRAGEGYFSANGRYMTFQSERDPANPFYQIYRMDLELGDVVPVSPGTGKTTCSFIHPQNPDVIMYASTHADPESERLQREELELRASGQERRYSWDYDPHFDIWQANLATGEQRRLSDALGYCAEGAYSPDGSMIVFASNRHIYAQGELSKLDAETLEINPSYFIEVYTMKADGSDVRRLTDFPGYDGGTFFSPDGERIIWRRFDETGFIADVWTMAVDGSDQRQITDFGAMSWAPYYHPTQEYVFFASNKLGFTNFEVFMVDAAGEKEPVRVTYTDGFDGLPVPTPDGTKLTWVSSRHGGDGGQIYIADWNHEAALAALEAAPPRQRHDAPIRMQEGSK